MAAMSAQAMSERLRGLLREALQARERGESERWLRAAHAYIDGYMRAMLDAELATCAELLELVASERARFAGPAVAELRAEPSAASRRARRRAQAAVVQPAPTENAEIALVS